MQLYKVLEPGLVSPYQGFTFEIGKEYICEEFNEDTSIACATGFYATGIDGLLYCFDSSREVWQVEVGGKSVEWDQFKRRYEKIRLVRRVNHAEVRELALLAEVSVGYKLSEVLFPIHPLQIERNNNVMKSEIALLKGWASVRASARDSARASVGASVGAAVRASVRAAVWDSVGASVWAAARASVGAAVGASVWDVVWAYIGSLFPTDGQYPFQDCVDLWYAGLVPIFDGTIWRLCAGESARIVWEGSKE